MKDDAYGKIRMLDFSKYNAEFRLRPLRCADFVPYVIGDTQPDVEKLNALRKNV